MLMLHRPCLAGGRRFSARWRCLRSCGAAPRPGVLPSGVLLLRILLSLGAMLRVGGVVLALGVIAAAAVGAQTPPSEEPTVQVVGRVWGQNDGLAVVLLAFTLDEQGRSQGGPIARTTTAADGRFRFANIDPRRDAVYQLGTRIAGQLQSSALFTLAHDVPVVQIDIGGDTDAESDAPTGQMQPQDAAASPLASPSAPPTGPSTAPSELLPPPGSDLPRAPLLRGPLPQGSASAEAPILWRVLLIFEAGVGGVWVTQALHYAYRGAEPLDLAAAALQVPLPPGAESVGVVESAPAFAAVNVESERLTLAGRFTTGVHPLVIRYRLPAPWGRVSLRQRFPQRFERLDVLTVPEDLVVRGAALVPLAAETIEERRYGRWQMDGLPPGSEVSLRLGGITPARMVFWWLLLPFFVLSLGAVVYALRRRKQDG